MPVDRAMSGSAFPPSHPGDSRRSDAVTRLRRRVVVSIVGLVAWISFTLLYVGFWAPHFSLFQSVVVVLVSLVVLAGVLAISWITFGLGFAHRWSDWSD
jgi:hypothetical protein